MTSYTPCLYHGSMRCAATCLFLADAKDGRNIGLFDALTKQITETALGAHKVKKQALYKDRKANFRMLRCISFHIVRAFRALNI